MIDFGLDVLRHSAAHVLAQAVMRKFPDAKLGIGPAIKDGFYYDFDLPESLTEDDFPELEASMGEIIKEAQSFHVFSLKKHEALNLMIKKNQPYKQELIESLDESEYSFYENGQFLDLCKGPHCSVTSDIPVFKLLRVSGAYWRGSEKNKMLQRIYGTVFYTKDDLDAYLLFLEEAKKRDHRVLGKSLDLFSIQDDVGGGLVLWHPKGAILRDIIESFWKKKHFEKMYHLLYTPHIGKSNLWEVSGHLQCYKESMYSPFSVDGTDYFVRPMNCPFHIAVFKHTSYSYRQLPVRFAELGTVYRYERSGVLHGLMRVRGFTQDDAHIICSLDQVDDEILSILSFCRDLLHYFGFCDLKVYLSTRPETGSVGSDVSWSLATAALKAAISKLSLPFDIDSGGGAFYGPKIDVKIQDAIGREWQCSTIQFDFNLPERFDMNFINSKGEKERPVMIHRAVFGSLERFIGILIEHYSGKFPFWLSPFQVRVLTVSEGVHDYAVDVMTALKARGVRVELDVSSEKIGYKIRKASQDKLPYLLILGKKESESETVSFRTREGESATLSLSDFLIHLSKYEKT